MKIILLFLFFNIQALYSQSGLLINEFVASNINSIRDENLNHSDWIELFNGSNSVIDIAGMYMSDDPDDPYKSIIPGGSNLTIIQPDSFLILWADSNPETGVLHLNFQLSSAGEQIILTANNGLTIIDSVSFPEQTANYSYGRSASNPAVFKYFSRPTPGIANGSGYMGIVNEPVIETASGKYSGSVNVIVTNTDSEATLFYSTNGNTPTVSDTPITTPVTINNSSVFSVRAFKDGYIPSATISNAYFIDEEFNLPVLSIITDPTNLFSDSIGIYGNYLLGGAFWERPVSNHYFKEDGINSFLGGIRIQGKTSRSLPKKSFRLFFKKGYGQDRLEYDMFGLPAVQSFKNLVLRSGYDDDISLSNSLGTLLRDPLVSEGWKRTGGLTSAGNFAVLYLNNDYWGIYNIRESINDIFIEDHLGYANFDLIRFDKSRVLLRAGTIDDWNSFWSFIENTDLSIASNYDTFKSMADIENILSFQAMVQCTEYRSWGWGAFAFKEKTAAGKWRLTLWDMDRAYTNQSWNGITIYSNTNAELWSNLMVQKLLLNESFKELFINRVADFLNFYYRPDKIHTLIDSLAAIIRPEIPHEAARWTSSLEKWETNVLGLHTFAENRPAIVFQQMQDYFGLSAPYQLTIELADENGKVKVNAITVNEDGWTGNYFPEIEIQITALAAEGYRFKEWSDPDLGSSPNISLNITENLTVAPVFEEEFTSDYFQIIAPSKAKTSENIPIIVRSKNPAHEVNTFTQGQYNLLSNSSISDSSFKIKKGAGVLVSNITAQSSFSLQVEQLDFESEQKNITINNSIPQTHHAGELAGNIEWDNSTDHIIDSDLTIPQGSSLTINAGSRILLLESVNIYIYGMLQVAGIKEDPVLFSSADTGYSWGGIEFLGSISDIQYAFFMNGGGDLTKGWAHTNTQPVLFAKEESEITLNNVYILHSPGKAVGALRSIFNMDQCVIANIWHGGEFSYSKIHVNNSYIMNIPNDDGISFTNDDDNDGFHLDNNHADGGESIIENSFFIDGKDDGIDQNRKNLTIKNCWIEGWLNEGVAASGRDTVKIYNTVSSNCTNGFESGNGNPQVIIDHSLVFNNTVGFRFGDNYTTANTGHMKITNSIAFNNVRNLRNYTKHLSGPLPGAIDVTYTMTNDTSYNHNLGNISGIPEFDEYYYLQSTSPGASAGINGTNMGLIEEIPEIASPIIINEIMYNSALNHNTEDWVEIYNPTNQAKKIEGWILKDQNDLNSFTLPAGTIINNKDYLVLCRDTSSFKAQHPDITNIIGNFDFGLSSSGDKVKILAPNNFIIDSVQFSSSGNWPSSPNGIGPSLELLNAFHDNNNYSSWRASAVQGGSPGTANSVVTAIIENPAQPNAFILYQNYPNPFNPQTRIKYHLAASGHVRLSVFDITGKRVGNLVDEEQQAGEHQVKFNASNLSSGIYIYQIKTAKYVNQKKMLFIK